jgi:tetratricopeptide (TPR) repeat protein
MPIDTKMPSQFPFIPTFMLIRRILLSALSTLIIAPSTIAQTAPTSSAADLLPTDTAGVLLINTDENTWQGLSRFGLFPADFSFPGNFYPIQAGLNFHTDIQPWLGDQIAIAFLPLKSSPDRALAIASVKDTTLIPKFLERLKAARRDVAIEHQYKGITILEWLPPKPTVTPCGEGAETKPCPEARVRLRDVSRSFSTPATLDLLAVPLPNLPSPNEKGSLFAPKGLAIAVLPGYVVTAFTIQPIQQLIDTQTEGKLATNPLFQRTIQQSSGGTAKQILITGYGDYTQILTAATAFNQAQINALPPGFPAPPKLDPRTLDVLGRYYDVVDGSVWAQPDGLHTQIGVHFKKPLPSTLLTSMTTRNQLLERLPEVSYVASNGQNLAIFWQALTTGLAADPATKKGLDQFRQLSRSRIGIDDRDIFPWMNGEIATFMYPTRQGFLPAALPNLDLGFGLMIQTRDRPAAEAAFSKLDQVVRTRIGKDVVNTRKIQGQPVTTWDALVNRKPLSVLSHGWIDKDTVLILGGGGAITEFSPKPSRSLPQSANFKAAIAPFSNANLGYSYVNGGAMMSLINNSIVPFFGGKDRIIPLFGRRESRPGLDSITTPLSSIRSISGASSVTPEKIQSEGFMALATTRTAPLTASQLIKLGQQKLETGKVDGAIANFIHALRLEPNNADAYTARADARLDDDAAGAFDDYTQALRIDSKNINAYSGRSFSKEQRFDYGGALQDLDQAIQLESDNSDFYLRRSKIRTVQEDYRGAIADATQAIRLVPESDASYATRCYSRARGLNDFKGALADCDKAIQLEGKSIIEFSSRCYVRANLGDKKAIEDCDRALTLELDPESSDIYENRGLAHAALGNKKAALADLQKAAEIFKQRGDTASQQRVEKEIAKLG